MALLDMQGLDATLDNGSGDDGRDMNVDSHFSLLLCEGPI
jgi:hypothetical protein